MTKRTLKDKEPYDPIPHCILTYRDWHYIVATVYLLSGLKIKVSYWTTKQNYLYMSVSALGPNIENKTVIEIKGLHAAPYLRMLQNY